MNTLNMLTHCETTVAFSSSEPLGNKRTLVSSQEHVQLIRAPFVSDAAGTGCFMSVAILIEFSFCFELLLSVKERKEKQM